MARFLQLRRLVILSALSIAIHWSKAGAVQVFPSSYTILTAAVYEDAACSTVSSQNTPVASSCFTRQSTGVTPKLHDTELGPENGLPSPTTDVAYTLNGTTMTSTETWIEFEFATFIKLYRVTLHYYCTGTPPRLQLADGSGTATAIMTPSCGNSTQRQFLPFNITSITKVVNLRVDRNGGQFYLSEVEFFADPVTVSLTPSPTLTSSPTLTPSPTLTHELTTQALTTSLTPQARPVSTSTPSIMRCETQSIANEPSTLPTTRTGTSTMMSEECISDGVAIAGWVIAALSILANGVLLIVIAAHCFKTRKAAYCFRESEKSATITEHIAT